MFVGETARVVQCPPTFLFFLLPQCTHRPDFLPGAFMKAPVLISTFVLISTIRMAVRHDLDALYLYGKTPPLSCNGYNSRS